MDGNEKGKGMMNQAEETVRLFEKEMNCSQAILTVYGKPLGLDDKLARKLGRPFGAGMGRLALTCGAVTGAMMVLGLAVENDMNEDDAKTDVYGLVQEFAKRFNAKYGTLSCKGLLGEDMSTQEGMQKITEEKLVARHCPQFVRDAANILESLL